MRKQTKLVAVLSAAALLAIGASMTSFAAKGWQEENGSWYYYTNDDDYVTNEWKKSGNNWFYLGDDGAMVTDSLIEDGDYMYYVNANGAMVTNAWVAVEPGDDDYDDNAPDHYWYRFGSNGKAYKAGDKGLSIKTINGKKYGFDSDSRMVYGFVTEDGQKNQDENPFVDAMYYFGDSDDGAMHTDWLQYMDGSDLTSDVSGKEYADMDEMWFYFKPSNGKMVKTEAGDTLQTQTVRGNKYGFDENGVMVYEWTDTASDSAATESGIKYFSDLTDGHLKKKTWIYAVPTQEMDDVMDNTDNSDDTSRWFYADAQGETLKSQIKKINGKKYLFNEVGEMESGLQWVTLEAGSSTKVVTISDKETDESDEIEKYSTSENESLYFFSEDGDTDGSMKTGKNIKIELDDDTFTFGFKSNGQAYDYRNDGLEDKKIYINGILQKASTDDKYKLVNTSDADDELKMKDAYLVGTSGTIVGTKKYVKDGDDNWWSVDANGYIRNHGSDDESKDKARCQAKNTNEDGEEDNFTTKIDDDGDVDVNCK